MGVNYLQRNLASVNSFLARGDFHCLLITFANILDPNQERQNVDPEKVKFEKRQQTTTKA